MTLDEIRKEKKVAEDAVKAILNTLQQRTGLRVHEVVVHDFAALCGLVSLEPEPRPVQGLAITMEGI